MEPPVGVSRTTEEVLRLENVTAGYGRATVLREVSITVRVGEVTALLGPNGAGKTTFLRTAAGVVRPASGRVIVGGVDMTAEAPNRRARAGLCFIPDGRGIFRNLTVKENLRLQAPPWRSQGQQQEAYQHAVDAFPVLAERGGQLAGSLSGGQQQMLALARAYLSGPRVVLLDEVSMGLAPKIVTEIFAFIKTLADAGVSLLLVEQYIHRALALADHVVLLDRGGVTFDGGRAELSHDEVLRNYLGNEAGSGTTADPHGRVAQSPVGTDSIHPNPRHPK